MFKKIFLSFLILSMMLVFMPVSAQAAGLSEGDNPPARPQPTGKNLEQAWAHLQEAYAKLGERQAKSDTFIANVQSKLDTAAAAGADVSAAQAALDDFAAAVAAAQPLYAEGQALIASHDGFDADGQVTDAAQAAETVKALAEKMKAIGAQVKPAGEALRTALQALGESVRPAPDEGKLAEVWSRLQGIYAKTMERLTHSDDFVARTERLLDKAAEQGADVSAAQDALDAFVAALDEAAQAAAEGQSIVAQHTGFDADGNVMDAGQAQESVRALGDLLKTVRDVVQPAGQALREAMQSLRGQLPNQRPTRGVPGQGASTP